MTTMEISQQINPWERLQQPMRPIGGLNSSFRLLLAALDTGWYVQEPVYLRKRWREDGPYMVHFILVRPTGQQQKLISVPAEPEVVRFINREGWSVDQLFTY